MNRLLQSAACLAAMMTSPAWSQAAAPLVFDDEGRPSTQVRVNDRADFLFAIDTAAQRTGIGAPIIDALELVPDPEQVGRMHGVSGVVDVDMYYLDTLQLGERRVENSLVVSLTGEHDRGGHSHEGILGQDVFASRRLELDFEGRQARLDPAIPAEVSASLPAQFKLGGFALVEIRIGDVDVIALIDTGAATSFGNIALLHELTSPADRITVREEVRGTSQDAIEIYAGLSAPVVFDAVTVEDQSLEFIDSPVFNTFRINDRPAIVLGMDVLGDLPGIVVDYETETVSIL